MKSQPIVQRASLRCFGLLAALAANSAVAQSASPAQALLDDSWVLNMGAFVLNSDVKANLNGRSTNNPEVDFDDTFGRAHDATRLRADALWRITPSHHLHFMYFNNDVTRSRVLDQDVHWGDYTFNAGSRADFKHKMEVAELAYEYAFLRAPTYEVSASLGVHYSKTTMQLSGAASITDPNGNVTNSSAATSTSTLPAPLPVIGLRAGWVVAPQWYIDAQAQFFKVSIDGYDGHWSDLRVGATWMFSPHFGVGLGYNRFATSVGVGRDNFNGQLKTSYSGLQAYLTGAF